MQSDSEILVCCSGAYILMLCHVVLESYLLSCFWQCFNCDFLANISHTLIDFSILKFSFLLQSILTQYCMISYSNIEKMESYIITLFPLSISHLPISYAHPVALPSRPPFPLPVSLPSFSLYPLNKIFRFSLSLICMWVPLPMNRKPLPFRVSSIVLLQAHKQYGFKDRRSISSSSFHNRQ